MKVPRPARRLTADLIVAKAMSHLEICRQLSNPVFGQILKALMAEYQFNSLVFHEDLLSARDLGGKEVTFTRAERSLLSTFMAHPQRLLTRNTLLDAISGVGSDSSDRNVDFLINRLRAKLGDPARSPRFIATRYGEGYVWVAEASEPADTLVVVGPVHGLARAGRFAELAEALPGELMRELDAAVSPGEAVRLDERFSPKSPTKTRFSLEVSVFPTDAALQCALVLRQMPGGDVVGMSRIALRQAGEVGGLVAGVVQQFRSLIWHRQALGMMDAPAAATPPLYVAMHEAGRLLTVDTRSWLEGLEQVRASLAANPDDPVVRLMWGLSLYVQAIMGTDGQSSPGAARNAIEDEIEAVALSALPAVADNPMLKLSVAKLLLFVARGHTAMAERLAEEAFEASTAFAASFAILGQARLMRGRLAEGIDLLERAAEMAEHGTEFWTYTLVVLCGGKLAAEDRAGLRATLQQLHEASPQTLITVAPFCVPADEPLSPPGQAFISSLGPAGATRTLEYIFMTSVRQYEDPRHQANVVRAVAQRLKQVYGPDVVPPRIRALLEPAAGG
ncbi:MAG: winged helix-turn-helix domain-containing protein [Devosia sp.]|nr:winged helix-turn-helix domain-containing protein [Devosia sp.]